MKLKQIQLLMISLLVSFILSACGDDNSVLAPVATDYSQDSHWLSAPASIKSVDVFYLYPTAWRKVNPTDPNICDIDNPSMLAGSASAFARQATALSPLQIFMRHTTDKRTPHMP